MRAIFLSLSILISVISFAQTESLVVVKTDTSKILTSYMLKDYWQGPYIHWTYRQNVGNVDTDIPFRIIALPILWKFRSKDYYKNKNKIKTF